MKSLFKIRVTQLKKSRLLWHFKGASKSTVFSMDQKLKTSPRWMWVSHRRGEVMITPS